MVMKLIYEAEIDGKFSEIDRIHNLFDMLLLKEKYQIVKSALKSECECPEITIHDSDKKCRVCGCDWFHACPGGCYWVEDDLCSTCAEDLANEMLTEENVGSCDICSHGTDFECAPIYVCDLTGEEHYKNDTCLEFCVFEDD